MILMRPSAVIEAGVFGDAAMQAIEMAARTCYKSEPKGDSAAFVRRLLDSQHESVIEHVGFTVRFIVDRGVSHELVRHRLAAFSQESTRYVDYTKAAKGGHCRFIIPPWCTKELLEGPATPIGNLEGPDCVVFYEDGSPSVAVDQNTALWLRAVASAEAFYRDLRAAGWSAQEARTVLPNSTKTELVMTANAREWRHVFKLRTSKYAHPQMREVMLPLLTEVKSKMPILFDDIEP